MKSPSKLIARILFAALYFSVVAPATCHGAVPTTGPSVPSGMTAEQWDFYCQGWTGAGGIVIPPSPPILAPLQRWKNQVHVVPGPYVANGADLSTVADIGKAGVVVALTPGGSYVFSKTTAVNCQLYCNGSDLRCDNPIGGSGSNLNLGAGCLVNSPHITKGYTLFNQVGKGAQVHNFFIDDYHEITPGSGLAGSWTGVKNRAFESLLVDKDTTPNLDVQTGWIGIGAPYMGAQLVYITCNAKFFNVYFAGSPVEYDFRTEVTGPTNTDRCQKVIVDTCTFIWDPSNGKGTTVGVRNGNGLTFTNCYIKANAYMGQNPSPPPTSATLYVNGCTYNKCKFVTFGTREPIDSNYGVTMAVTGCEFWMDQAKIAIAIAPSASVCSATDNIVHVPLGGVFKQFTNSTSQPGTGTKLSTDPYVVPAPPLPF